MNEDKIKKDLEEIETINIELDHRVSKLIAKNEHLKQTYKQLYDSIKPTPLKDDLRKLKGKYLVDNVVTKHTIDPEMLKIDVDPITPKLLNKRTTHSAYIKPTQEEAAVLRDLVEHVKANYPLDHSLEYAFRYTKLIQELLTNIRIIPSTSASGSQPSGNTKKDKIQKTPSSTLKNKVEATLGKKVQREKFGNQQERCLQIVDPTGQIFTIEGNACPLTRIPTTPEVPLRKPTDLENETPKHVVTLVYLRKPRKSKTNVPVYKSKVVQIVLWYLDSGCSKHMTEDRSQLTNFINKFLGTVKFGNDHVAKILGYGDYQIGNVTISRVYYVEGLGHNLFSVRQFCNSNLEVAFRQHTCFIRNLEGVDLLTGSRGNNLYTLSLGDMMASSHICLLSKASKTKSWLWHRRLSHMNFGAINHLARHGLVRGLPKLKFEKDHLCLDCAMGKSKKKSHKPKSEDTNQEKLYLLHMDLCGPMRVASVNGKKSKDEAPDFIIKFLKMIQVRLKVHVCQIRTNNGTEFVNQTLREYYEKVGISHETSVARSPQQNGVDILFQPLFDELLTPPPSVDHPAPEVIALIAEVVAPEPAASTGSPSSTTVDQEAPSPSNSQTTPETQSPIIPNDVEEDNHDLDVAHMNNDPFFGIPIPENHSEASSSSDVIPTVVHTAAPYSEHVTKWTKDHPLDNIIGELERPVSTRLQLHEQALFCYYDAFLSSVEPKTYKDALTQSCWIEAMQEELNEFERLEVWELVPRPDKVMVITLKWIYKNDSKETLREEVYVSQPDGFVDQDNPNHVYKLKKALYGLKQAPHVWYDLLSKFLLSQEFSKGTTDPTLFIRRQGKDIILAKPTEKHLHAVKRIFKYLRGIVNRGLCTSRCMQLLGDRLLSWSSKRQKSAAISSTEAEYIALSGCCAQVLWMRSQLTDNGLGFNKIPMYCDKQKRNYLILQQCSTFSDQKQIDIRFHFKKRASENEVVELYFVNTEYQLADIFTKALGRERIEFLINKLGMRSFTPETLKQLEDETEE
ncbi:retrovirus-related pol polyprotein from transposon TNT 1-94 [Tanacetum coccineum]